MSERAWIVGLCMLAAAMSGSAVLDNAALAADPSPVAPSPANPSPVAPPPVAVAPTLDQLLLLRSIGFNEAQIRAEIEPFAATARYPDDAAELLRAAGFSEPFVSFVASLAPKPVLDNAAIGRLLDDGLDAVAIIDAIAAATADFDTSAMAMLALQDGRTVPAVVTKAMQGAALTIEDVRLLAASGATAEEQLRLIELVGHDVALADAGEALQLAQAGVPGEVLAALRTTADAPAETDAAPGDAAAGEAAAPPVPVDEELEHFAHVTNLFSVAYPRNWFFTRYADGDATLYQATPTRPRGNAASLDAATPAVTLRFWLRDKANEGAEIVPTALVGTGLARFYAHLLDGLEPMADAEAITIDGRQAAYRDYRASVDGRPIALRWYLIVADDHYVAVMVHADAEAFAQELPRLARLAEATRVPGTPFAERRAQPYSSSELAARYRKAVVAIQVSDDNRRWASNGTGFFVRSDGYLLTNHHVVFDTKTGQPHRYFRVAWSDDLELDAVDAELVSLVREESRIGGFNTGEDLAILKVDAVTSFDTIPLSPLDRTEVGDTLMTVGFPILSAFDRRLSTTISTGVVTRFNRDVNERVETIITDAKIAPGNSGGPAISLVTGGVIGLNTTGNDPLQAMSEDRSERHSIGYYGIMPIDRAIEYYPQATMVTATRNQSIDAIDAFDLAEFAAQKNWRRGAMELARAAIERAPNAAASRHLLAKILLAEHPDRKPEDLVAGERELQRALTIDPGFEAALYTRADFEMEREAYLEAIKAVNKAVEEQETWAAFTKRARIYAVMEQPDDALADLTRAKALAGGTVAEPFIQAGDIYYGQEKYEEGLAEFRQAVAIAPTNVTARLGVGRYHLYTEKYLAALLEFDAVREDQRKEPDVYALIGRTYARQGNHERAVTNFADAVNFYNDAERIPPEDMVAEAAETAADKLLDQRLGTQFHAIHLGFYYDSRETLAAHRYLASRATDEPAIRRAHLVRAVELKGNTQDDERKKLEEDLAGVRDARLAVADIRKMRERRYPIGLVVRLIDEHPGDFALAGQTTSDGKLDDARWAELSPLIQEFGSDIAQAIYAKVRAAERDGGGERQAAQQQTQQQAQQQNGQGRQQREGVSLSGTWVREVDGRRAEVFFTPDSTYRIEEIIGGQRTTRSQGSWTWEREGEGFVLVLTYQDGGQQREARVPFKLFGGAAPTDDRLVLTQGGQEREYRRGAG